MHQRLKRKRPSRVQKLKESVDAKEYVRIAAEREKTHALAEAQARPKAEAEKNGREGTAAQLARRLEEERARQRREKEEMDT
ncbi:hypothetical protein PsorP6_001389 [Peronosclerospora sorghi]|uniref:Uncharacterized protein n=1 Tax=Peronosclerospora sorghi TaxID=230839 RepID=A0ACC0WST7_9STRA|nr:hypothetical protein PsorP6_001389 [Peronosclerospora sorghi]